MPRKFGAFGSSNALFRRQSEKDINNTNRWSMGNIPSTQSEPVTPVGSQRLTKPRTNNNFATSGKKDSDSNKSTSAPNSKPSSRGTNGPGELLQPDPFENFSQASPNLLAADEAYFDEFPSSISTPNLTHASRSLNASSTSISAQTGFRKSYNGDGSDLDVAAAISLLQELKKKASPEELVALHKALLPTRSVDPEVTAPIPEVKEPTETISPLIRRSSLLPAGVATRVSLDAIKRRVSRNPSQETRRRSSSQGAPTSRSGSRRTKSGTWEQFVEGGFDSLDAATAANNKLTRAVTPSDFEVAQIGTYKLGSLRITNGAASPEPNTILKRAGRAEVLRSTSASAASAAADAFFTADEGESNTEQAKVTVRTSPKKSRSVVDMQSQPTSPTESQPMPKTNSPPPLRLDTRRVVSDGPATKLIPRRPVPIQTAAEPAKSPVAEVEAPSSPYTDGAQLSARASRLSTVEDNSPVDGRAGGPEEALKKLTGGCGPNQARKISASSQSSADGNHLQAPRRSTVQGKTDSGYSSESSWQAQAKVLVEKANADGLLDETVKATDYDAPSRPASVAVTNSAVASPRTSLDRPRTAGLSTVELSIRHQSMPVSRVNSKDSDNAVMVLTKPKQSKKTKKLQKARPKSRHQSPVSASKDDKENQVPDVPESLSVNFSRRLRLRPGMSHLDQTFSSVDETGRGASTEQLPAEEDEKRGRGRGRSKEPKPALSNDLADGESKRSSSIFRRFRSRSRSQHRASRPPSIVFAEDEPMPANLDFSTVTQSLGGSPYDIATRHFAVRKSADGSRPLFQAHEITSELQSSTSMDDKTAAEFARMRSRDVAEQKAEERRARSQSRPRKHVADLAASTEDLSGMKGAATPAKASPPKASRPTHKRSASAHSKVMPSVPTVPEHAELPIRPSHVRVGTIKFDGGEAQGRLSPLAAVERPRTTRRSQSVAPRVRYTEDAKSNKENIPAMPQLTTPPTTSHSMVSNSSFDKTAPPMPVPAGGWEQQARLWHERRKTLGDSLSPPSQKRRSYTAELANAEKRRSNHELEKRKSIGEVLSSSSPPRQSYVPTNQAPRQSPAIVISRYVTPTGDDLEGRSENAKPADDPYKTYRTENPTEHVPAKEDIDRTDSAISNGSAVSKSSYKTAASVTSFNSATSGNSANFRNYHRANNSMTRLSSPPPETSTRAARFQARRSNTAPVRPISKPLPSPELMYDRYSGGMGYGWERGSGFGGSAGTRQGGDMLAKRRSLHLSGAYGVDLSDVPVFLTR